MFKTLLAGTILSTGLLAGGAVGADDAKMDNLKSNEDSSNQVITQSADGTTSFSQNFDAPKDAVPATPKGDVKTVERTEGTGSQEGKMVPTKEGNYYIVITKSIQKVVLFLYYRDQLVLLNIEL
ncbi:hypothetical protein [Bacillus mycoides]|nr:hypothetical protein [Bacillus mycoides]